MNALQQLIRTRMTELNCSYGEIARRGGLPRSTVYHLASNPGVVMTHETLLSRVWGPEYRDASHYVRLYINYLRQKLEDDPANPRYILTERGVGYRFADHQSRIDG